MSDDDERRPLVVSEAFFAITAAETDAHPWTAAAIQKIASDPACDPRDAFLCFIIGPDSGARRAWRLVGVGRVVERSDGRPSPLHVPGRTRGGLYRHPWGRVYYVAWWDGERPFLIETWELRVEQPDQTAVGHLSWRPGDRRPKLGAEGLEGLGRTRREALVREIWAYLEPQSKAGPKPRDRKPDPKWEGELEKAVRELIVDYQGEPIQVADVQTKLVCKPGEYYGRLEAVGLTSAQVRDWIRACVRDFRNPDRDNGIAVGDDWQLPVRLADLPRDFAN